MNRDLQLLVVFHLGLISFTCVTAPKDYLLNWQFSTLYWC